MANNVSGGIEPVFSHHYERTIRTFDGPRTDRVEDYGTSMGVKGRTADELSVHEHLSVLSLAQHYVDSACSKTINVGENVTYDEFKKIYTDAWAQGCKGATTFRVAGKRYGVLNATVEAEEKIEGKIEEATTSGVERKRSCLLYGPADWAERVLLR